jgi:hypothetical protein
LIFIFSAFEPIHEDPNWELVYPELALGHSDDLDHSNFQQVNQVKDVEVTGISGELDKMLEEAKIDSVNC